MASLTKVGLLKMDWTEVAFAEENASHTWVDIPAHEGATVNPGRMVHPLRRRRQYLTDRPGQVLGRKTSDLTYSVDLVGDGVALTAAATPADDALQTALARCLGGTTNGQGSTAAAAGNTTTQITFATGEGARFLANTAIMCEGTAADGGNEVTWISSITDDVATLAVALTNALTEGDVIWNGYTAYCDRSATATCQAQIIGDDSDDVWIAMGLCGKITLQDLLQLQDTAAVQFAWTAADWDTDTGTIAAGTYDGASPLGTDADIEIHLQTAGTTTRNLVATSQLDIDPGVTWTQTMARGNGDHNHVDRVNITAIAPTGSMTLDIDDYLTAFEAGTRKTLMVACGRTPGSSWAIVIPRLQITKDPERADHFEQLARKLTFEADQSQSGDASTALMRSPIFITRL